MCEAPNWLHLIKVTIGHAKSYHWVSRLCICNNLPIAVENLYYLPCPAWFTIENHLQNFANTINCQHITSQTGI